MAGIITLLLYEILRFPVKFVLFGVRQLDHFQVVFRFDHSLAGKGTTIFADLHFDIVLSSQNESDIVVAQEGSHSLSLLRIIGVFPQAAAGGTASNFSI